MGNFRKFQDALDIQKKTGYKFNKWIFRVIFLLIICMVAVVWYGEGFGVRQHIYITCPEETPNKCINENYQNCDEKLVMSWQLQWLKEHRPVLFEKSMEEIYGWCDVPFLLPGESYGTKPSFLYTYFSGIVYMLMLVGLVINHLLYNKGFFKDKKVQR
jgi:hypothetical protein